MVAAATAALNAVTFHGRYKIAAPIPTVINESVIILSPPVDPVGPVL